MRNSRSIHTSCLSHFISSYLASFHSQLEKSSYSRSRIVLASSRLMELSLLPLLCAHGNRQSGCRIRKELGTAETHWLALRKYLTRYLTRNFSDHVPHRVRLTSGRADNKVGTTRFQWVGGLARVWRTGCSVLSYQPKWSDNKGNRDAWRLGCLRLGISYLDVMHCLVGLGGSEARAGP